MGWYICRCVVYRVCVVSVLRIDDSDWVLNRVGALSAATLGRGTLSADKADAVLCGKLRVELFD